MTLTDWYDERASLEPDQIFRMFDGSLVKLDRRVAGDGTKWFVADWCNGHWSYEDGIIEPCDLHSRVFNDTDLSR
jgi:hypothetical protein